MNLMYHNDVAAMIKRNHYPRTWLVSYLKVYFSRHVIGHYQHYSGSLFQ